MSNKKIIRTCKALQEGRIQNLNNNEKPSNKEIIKKTKTMVIELTSTIIKKKY